MAFFLTFPAAGVAQSVPPISGGVLPDFDNFERVTTAWRPPDDTFFDLVIDPRARSADPDADGRAIVRRLVSRHGAKLPINIEIVDNYAFDAQMLRVVATELPRGSTIRIICGQCDTDADYRAVFVDTGVHVERYTAPAIPQHDRFLRIHGALWSIGASLNHLGHCFSAILEVRDARTVVAISSIIDACLTAPPVAHS